MYNTVHNAITFIRWYKYELMYLKIHLFIDTGYNTLYNVVKRIEDMILRTVSVKWVRYKWQLHILSWQIPVWKELFFVLIYFHMVFVISFALMCWWSKRDIVQLLNPFVIISVWWASFSRMKKRLYDQYT